MIRWVKGNSLSDKSLKEMRYIMNGILSGELNHNQGSWHQGLFKDKEGNCVDPIHGVLCGTAHCFAGWCEFLGRKSDSQKKLIEKVSINFLSNKLKELIKANPNNLISLGRAFSSGKIYNNQTASTYTKNRWGLTDTEGSILFDGDNTEEYLNELVEQFESGLRMENTHEY